MSLRCALPGCTRFLASQDAVRFEIRKAGNTPSCILYHPHCALAAAAALKRDAESAMNTPGTPEERGDPA